ncbi:hypothetical protein E8E13_011118 [Curvularia kusanoi]|uniref:BTB domain-containing protein n=1 Tax=Curvularia kusanoi TaxID=90978 RepID=A0A9P4TMP4_CURKU|nr:hypothetical protein E8E13_011118 [Curvularia kusanoi]
MSEAQQRPAAGLFNNSLLSDVKIKRVSSDGKIREYHAHKAVLSSDSRYFHKAFTGNFREATEAEMTIHDDDPDHFEFFLKFIYTHAYDTAKITELANGDPIQRVTIPCEILALADKYNMPLLIGPIANDIEKLLADKTSKTLDLLKALIPVYYKGVQSVV